MPSTVQGQVVRGVLVESETGNVLSAAAVVLSDTSGVPVARAMTDQSGRFVLKAPGRGTYILEAMALGYERYRVGPFFLRDDEEPDVELPMAPSPVPIPGLRAEVERVRIDAFLESQGFYRRQQRGLGRFFTPEEIAAADPARYVDLLSRAPGVYFSYDGHLGEGLACGNFGDYSGSMIPEVYIDGTAVEFPSIPGAGSSVHLDTVLPVQHVAAIEIYRRRSEAPLEFSGTRGRSSSSCVVLIWSKSG